MTTEQEEYLKNCDYQMKKFELTKEALFFQKYAQGYETSLEEKERDLEKDG